MHHLFQRRSLTRLGAITLITLCASATFVSGSGAATTPNPPSAQVLASAIKAATTTPTKTDLADQLTTAGHSSYQLGPCVQKQSAPGDSFLNCDFGVPSASKTVVLLGDSQAAMWLPAFDAAGKAHNFHVVLLSRLGCNSNPLVLLSFSGTVDAQCSVFRSATLKYLRTLHAPQVFVAQLHRYPQTANRTPVSDATWASSMKTLYASIKGAGAISISFLEPAPVDPTDGAACLSQHATSSQKCTYPALQGFVTSARTSDEQAATASRVNVVNTLSLYCTGSTITASTLCPVQVNGLLVYADRWHTSSQYSAYVWQGLAALTKL